MRTGYRVIISALLATALAAPAVAAGKKSATPPQPPSQKPAMSVPGMDIAAIVNDEAISSYDVDSRIKYIVATANLSNTSEVAERIRPQIIRSLIDEKLQMKAATKEDIKITDKDVDAAIADIEKKRNMAPGAIRQILKDHHVPEYTFIAQIRAQLAWSKLVIKKLRPEVKISDAEIDLAKQKIAAPTGKQELQISVLALPVDKPQRENEVHQLGEKLVKEIRGGANFEEVSRQFSNSPNASSFWVSPDQLDPAVGRALTGAKAGSVTDPVRTSDGYTIVKVYNTRALAGSEQPKQIEVTLKEILLKLKPDADAKEADVLLQIGEEVAKHPGSCQEKGIAGMENLQDFDIDVDFRTENMSELPDALRIIAENLKVGDISTPFASYEGIRLYMLCDKKDAPPVSIDRNQVMDMLYHQKIELEAQKYMRNLRREAFIDIRG